MKINDESSKPCWESSKSAPTPSTNNNKIVWRPSLEIIFKDELLLKTLLIFAKKCYNEENILFLQSVKELNNYKNDQIDDKIISIYDDFIDEYAKYKINLSYKCSIDIISQSAQFTDYDLDKKRAMFAKCVHEIERLILTSILPKFYCSSLFQNIAKKSRYYEQKYSYYAVGIPSKEKTTKTTSSRSRCFSI